MMELTPCSQCGITGIHACLGYFPKTLTQEQIEEQGRSLREAVARLRALQTRGNDD